MVFMTRLGHGWHWNLDRKMKTIIRSVYHAAESAYSKAVREYGNERVVKFRCPETFSPAGYYCFHIYSMKDALSEKELKIEREKMDVKLHEEKTPEGVIKDIKIGIPKPKSKSEWGLIALVLGLIAAAWMLLMGRR